MLASSMLPALLVIATAASAQIPAEAPAVNPLTVRDFLPGKPIARALRPLPLAAIVGNASQETAEVVVTLSLPAGVRVQGEAATRTVTLEPAEEVRVEWEIAAAEPREHRFAVSARVGDGQVAAAELDLLFLPPVDIQKLGYIPEPEPAESPLLVGAHHCPLWEADKPQMWANIIKHPERTPALGFYSQENPEVSDWETKWAVEHGIDFFIYCWYRTSQGGPVTTQFSSAIHDALFKSRFVDKMKFTIMWENQSRGRAGVADEADLMQTLLPFWMENYFTHPSYLKVDGKPVLFVYRPEFLIEDLGGEAQVVAAFDKMRQACRDAGFSGLYILGEYRGLDPNHLQLMKRLGLDYTFAYCWHVPDSPTPQVAIDTQTRYIERTQELGVLPQVVTVSQAWSGWSDEGSIWKIPPQDFETLLVRARDFVATLPAEELGSRMLLLDNWNEWGEGHYIAPYREYGFGYLDAVRKTLTSAPDAHTDLIPEDIGMGPYDTAYVQHMQQDEEARRLMGQRVLKPGAPEEGLVAWWAFDEEQDSPAALDYSGHRLGGALRNARRAQGLDGSALLCDGGAVSVAPHPSLSPTSGLSIECWVKTDVAGQGNNWIVNRVYSGGISTGYRLGVLEGRPCFEVPLTDWSHHLQAEVDLPTGRWVHLAGTFDGERMRIYVDGRLSGTMERPGPVKANDFRLTLASYEPGHQAHFRGLLDEVKLYSRPLSAEEVAAHHALLADNAQDG